MISAGSKITAAAFSITPFFAICNGSTSHFTNSRFAQSRDLSFSLRCSFSQNQFDGRKIDCRKMEAEDWYVWSRFREKNRVVANNHFELFSFFCNQFFCPQSRSLWVALPETSHRSRLSLLQIFPNRIVGRKIDCRKMEAGVSSMRDFFLLKMRDRPKEKLMNWEERIEINPEVLVGKGRRDKDWVERTWA